MKLRTLLEKYMSGKMKATDFPLFRDSISQTSDRQLDAMLESLWMDKPVTPMDSRIKKEVKDTLEHQLGLPGKKHFLSWKNIAVAILLPVCMLSTVYLLVTGRLDTGQEFIVESAKGQKTQLLLPDGSKVWLNSGSHISYNSKYNQRNRTISLKGEAFFEVESNPGSKFRVNVGEVAVVVHGTAFNVEAYEGDSIISVSLNRGKVSLENQLNNQRIAQLQPNQSISINRYNLSSQITDCDADLNSLWTQNRLKLEEATTAELFRKMEHWYGVTIDGRQVNPNNRYSLTIKTESLREMLGLINRITPITYTINGEEVTVSDKK